MLHNTSRLDVSQGFIGGEDIMGAHSASPSSFFTPNREANENCDNSLIDLQGNNMFTQPGQTNMNEGLNKSTIDADNEFINRSLVDQQIIE